MDFSRAIGFVAVARWARKHFWLSALRVRGERDGITLFVRSLSFSAWLRLGSMTDLISSRDGIL